MTAATAEIEVGGRRLRLTSLDRVLWPETGTTKGDLLDYYLAAAPVLLPHVERRPLTLVRFPEGIQGPGWFQTRCPHPPDWLPTQPVPSPRAGGPGRDYCLLNEPAALVWAVNLASIELHPLLARAPDLDRPTAVVFDLDPGEGATVVDCCRVALWLREALAARGLRSLPKTSGWTGLHVYVPLNGECTYARTKAFARQLARRLAEEHPDLVTDRMERRRRVGRVFVDWAQNDASKSIVAPYSVRAALRPSVSTPLRWIEVEAALATGDPGVLLFDPVSVVTRLQGEGDLFLPVLGLVQELPA